MFRSLLLCVAVAGALSAQIRIEHGEFHGWKGAIYMRNPSAVAVIVPSIGRVMQFGLLDDNGKLIEGPFFNNHAVDGKPVDPASKEWINFGGDKSWPAPQSAWPKIIGRAWPPPQAFDSAMDDAAISDDTITVTLTSPIDKHYGIRERRSIRLDPEKPEMFITTEYEKVEGEPVEVAVWVITQLNAPQEASASRPSDSHFAEGYTNLSNTLPYKVKIGDSAISAQRDPAHATKIGTDGNTLTWVGTNALGRPVQLKIERLQDQDGTNPQFPDGGCHIEIYTNPDPLAYVEMETLGPLRTMRKADRIRATNHYSLYQLRTIQSGSPQ